MIPPATTSETTHAPGHRWRPSSIALIVLAWAILQLGGLFTPGLLDDVDSVYIQIAREMLQRHDFVTPTIDGIRFFDKPPLMYWMAAGSMHLFGIHDWAARLPLALGVLALLVSVYALGIRFFGNAANATVAPEPALSSSKGFASGAWISSNSPAFAIPKDRGGLYAALAMATCLGPYLYTRFYIPDILIALWMTLAVHLFLIAQDRISAHRSSLPPMLGFGAVLALSVLTKGLIGIVFPIFFVLMYLAFTRNLHALARLHIPAATLLFAIIAAPWHILAALRNPAIAMPTGIGLPARAGWAWFYLYNEHIARFLGRRIPHDYGQVPIPLFWALLLLWLFPWVAFLPSALINAIRTLRRRTASNLRFDFSSATHAVISTETRAQLRGSGENLTSLTNRHDANSTVTRNPSPSAQEAALTCLLWAGIILGFFTLSSRQEYYHLPALPALALLVGGLLAAAEAQRIPSKQTISAVEGLHVEPVSAELRATLRSALFFLAPIGAILFFLCTYLAFTAPTPHPGVTLNDVLSSNPALYNLSLGHVFDLTTTAMGFFRGPLLLVAIGMLFLGPIAYLLRRRSHTFAANLLIAASMIAVLLAAHVGLVRFYPILGSKALALQVDAARRPGDLVLIDGELTSGSTLLFYSSTPAPNTLLVNGRVNGPWFGSFWPDAPHIFANEADLHHLWSGPRRVFLLTYNPTQRTADLSPFGPVHTFATSGGKTILTNR